MNSYLLTLALKPDLEEKARESLISDIKKAMLGSDGKVEKEDMWGMRDLSYPIKKQSKAFYAHFEFASDPAVAKQLDKVLKVEEDIIRYLFVRKDK